MDENFPRPLERIPDLYKNGLLGFEDHYQKTIDQYSYCDQPDHGDELNKAGEIYSLR
jgi:hypothetical protein